MNFEFRDSSFESVTTPDSSVAASAAPVSESVKSSQASKRAEEIGAKLAAELKVFHQVAAELKDSLVVEGSMESRCKQVLDVATELFGVAPTWTAFYREILGCEGAARALFCNASEMGKYECSDEHGKILGMLAVLRSRDLPDCDPNEAQRMITIRIPKSLHDSICKEANDLQVSVNKLCITRLVQRVDRGLIPTSAQKRRGRRPGADYSRPAASQIPVAVEHRVYSEDHGDAGSL